jgi:hypothetical protein
VFERFTERARRVVVLAQEEARLLVHNYIGTEHVLLGLIHEGEGIAAQALESLDISLTAVRAQVEEIIGHGDTEPTGHIPFTPRAKKVLELSLREALQLGHNYIGTEHILLGLIREGEGVAAQVLVNLGADLPTVRTRVILILSGYTGAPGTPARSFHVANAPRCSFCMREVAEVAHYAPGFDSAICDECINAAHAALEAATGEPSVLVVPPRVIGSVAFDEPPPAEQITRAFRDLPPIPGVALRLFEIRFTPPDVAALRFFVSIEGVTNDVPAAGGAIRSGGEWVVSRDTIARALRELGIEPPPDA